MSFIYEERPSDSPFVDAIWRGHTERAGSRIAPAGGCWVMLIERQERRVRLSVVGPMTRAMPMRYAGDVDFLVIKFRLGTFMPDLPARNLLDAETILPEAASQSFWLNGSAWQCPDFENVEPFVDRLARSGLLARDALVDAVLHDEPQPISDRSVQRRFLRATGLTHRSIRRIRRARHAMSLLQRGVSIDDAVFEAGYADQPHLTNSLKRLIGQTPAQILRSSQPEHVSLPYKTAAC